MGNYIIFKSEKDGKYYFNLHAGNGQVVLSSTTGYETKDSAVDGVYEVSQNAMIDERFDRRFSKSNKPYFILKSESGNTIGISEMYESKSATENGISAVIIYANSNIYFKKSEDTIELIKILNNGY